MIVVRDVFQLRFGAAREAVALWQEALGTLRRSDAVRDARLLTDLTGQYYTLVFESSYDDLGAYEREMRSSLADPEWKAWYQRFVPLAEGGRREMFTVVGSGVPPLGTAAGAATATTRR